MTDDADVSDIRDYMSRRIRRAQAGSTPAASVASADVGTSAPETATKPGAKDAEPSATTRRGFPKPLLVVGGVVLVVALVGFVAYAALKRRRADAAKSEPTPEGTFTPRDLASFTYGSAPPAPRFVDHRDVADVVPSESPLNDVVAGPGASVDDVALTDPEEADACFTPLEMCARRSK